MHVCVCAYVCVCFHVCIFGIAVKFNVLITNEADSLQLIVSFLRVQIADSCKTACLTRTQRYLSCPNRLCPGCWMLHDIGLKSTGERLGCMHASLT